MKAPVSTIAVPGGLSKTFLAVSTIPAEQPRHKPKGSPVFKMRLTPDERARLEQSAGETPLATYIKLRLFNNLPPLETLQPVRPGGRPATETQLIAKLLAALGASRMASNLNQLAKAANMGVLEVGPETDAEIREACAAVQAMRADLVAALGRVKGSARA